jgi:hypothetical protein
MTLVLILNDNELGCDHLQTIKAALNTAFEGTDCTFEVNEPENPVNLNKTTPSKVAREVMAMPQPPDIVLVDGRMPYEPTDGVRVVDALRRAGFRGFSYLWSAADPATEVRSQPVMFAPPGCGGYVSSNPQGLASDVRNSWDHQLGKFEVSEREKRLARDPMYEALRLLTELQMGLFAVGKGTITQESWAHTCGRAQALFRAGPESFEAAVAPFKNRGINLDDADYTLRMLPTMNLANLEQIVQQTVLLRDCLLKAVAVCRS